MGESRLLVISCSKSKFSRPGESYSAPAGQLYGGSAYRVAKKRNRGFGRIPVLILSAKYGLISDSQVISVYDQKMDAARVEQLKANSVVGQARSLVRSIPHWPFTRVFCHCGEFYRQVLREYERCGVFGKARVEYSEGRIGEQLSQLRHFLEGTGA